MPLYTTQGIFVYRGTEVNKQHIVHWSNDGMVTIHRYGLQYMLNIAQCTCAHLLKGRAHIKWSKNLRISWQSYRYHQYPKYIPSYLEPLLALLGDGQAWTPNIYLKSFDLDSVQVGKAVFVKESYTTLGIEPRTYSYPVRLVTILVSVGLKKTCGQP